MQYSIDLPNEILDSTLAGISDGLKAANLAVPQRTYIGMGPVPSEDCCPDLVGWITNVRPWDASSPDTLTEGRLLGLWGIAFDLNIRIGLCYTEGDAEGNALHSKELTKASKVLNRYGMAAYLATLNTLTAYECDGESGCLNSITPLPMSPYNTGGCAGWNITISIGIL